METPLNAALQEEEVFWVRGEESGSATEEDNTGRALASGDDREWSGGAALRCTSCRERVLIQHTITGFKGPVERRG